MRKWILAQSWVLAAAVLLWAEPAEAQQNLGHKILGGLGLLAASQPEPGLYVADRVLFYAADHLVDRNGIRVPVEVDIDAFANGIGVSVIALVPALSTYLNFAAALPYAHVRLRTERAEASVDRFGLGDLYIQPLRLGWRLPGVDLVTGYAFYAPTGQFEAGGRSGVGRGHWTHEISAGGTIYFDSQRRWNVSALGSYDFNQEKRGIDLRRGDTIQIQGGAGTRFFKLIDVGVAGYAEWQVEDDSGTDLPAALRGARERVYGLGPEVDLLLPWIRSRLTLRYVRDISARARPVGQIFVIGFTFAAFLFSEPPEK